MNYDCYDPDGGSRTDAIAVEADSPSEAADAFVETGDWTPDEPGVVTVVVYVRPSDWSGHEDDGWEDFTIAVEFDTPECEDGEHEWTAPHEIVGGCAENPGVMGLGGLAIMTTRVCSACGAYRLYTDDEQNGDRVEYRDADEKSLAWIESLEEATA